MSQLPPIEDSGNPYLGSLPSISSRILALADYIFQSRNHSLENHGSQPPFLYYDREYSWEANETLCTRCKECEDRSSLFHSTSARKVQTKSGFHSANSDDAHNEDAKLAQEWKSDASSLATSFPHIVLYTEEVERVIRDENDKKNGSNECKENRGSGGGRNRRNIVSSMCRQMPLKSIEQVLDTFRIREAFFKHFFNQVLRSTSLPSRPAYEPLSLQVKEENRENEKGKPTPVKRSVRENVENRHYSPSSRRQRGSVGSTEYESPEEQNLRDLLSQFFAEAHYRVFDVLQTLEGDATCGLPPLEEDAEKQEDEEKEREGEDVRRRGSDPSERGTMGRGREMLGTTSTTSTSHDSLLTPPSTVLGKEIDGRIGKAERDHARTASARSSTSHETKHEWDEISPHSQNNEQNSPRLSRKDGKREGREVSTTREDEEESDAEAGSHSSSSVSCRMEEVDDLGTTVELPTSPSLLEHLPLDVSSAMQFFMSLAFSCPSTCISTATQLVLADVAAKRQQLRCQAKLLRADASRRKNKRSPRMPHSRHCGPCLHRWGSKHGKKSGRSLSSHSLPSLRSEGTLFRCMKRELAQLHLWEYLPQDENDALYDKVLQRILRYNGVPIPSSTRQSTTPALSSTGSPAHSVPNRDSKSEKKGFDATQHDFINLEKQEQRRHVRLAAESLQWTYSGCEDARVVMLTPLDTVLWVQRDGAIHVGSGKDWCHYCQGESFEAEHDESGIHSRSDSTGLYCSDTNDDWSSNFTRDAVTMGHAKGTSRCPHRYSNWGCWCHDRFSRSRVVGYTAPRRCSEELPFLQHMLLKNEEEAAMVMKLLALRAASPFFSRAPAGLSSLSSSSMGCSVPTVLHGTHHTSEAHPDGQLSSAYPHDLRATTGLSLFSRIDQMAGRKRGKEDGEVSTSVSYSPLLCLALSHCQLVPPPPFALTRKEILCSVFRDCGECPSYYPLLASSSPSLLLAHHQTQRFLFFQDGPLSIETRLMVAIMAASHHRCRYLTRRYAALFWLYISRVPTAQEDEEEEEKEEDHMWRGSQGKRDTGKGEGYWRTTRDTLSSPVSRNSPKPTLSWLERHQSWLTHGPPRGIQVAQQWIALAAHQPWCATASDVEYCVTHGWSISSIIHLTALIANVLSLTSFVIGLMVHPELWTAAVLPQTLVDQIDEASHYQTSPETEQTSMVKEKEGKPGRKQENSASSPVREKFDGKMIYSATTYPLRSSSLRKCASNEGSETGVMTTNSSSSTIFMRYTGQDAGEEGDKWRDSRASPRPLPMTTTSAMSYSPKYSLWSSEFDWQESGVALMDQYYPHAATFFLEESAQWQQGIDSLTSSDAAGATLPASASTPVLAFLGIRYYVMKLLGYITSHYNFDVINHVVRPKAKAFAQRMVLTPEVFLSRFPIPQEKQASVDGCTSDSLLPTHHYHYPYDLQLDFSHHSFSSSSPRTVTKKDERSIPSLHDRKVERNASQTAKQHEQNEVVGKEEDKEDEDETAIYLLSQAILKNMTHENEMKYVARYFYPTMEYPSELERRDHYYASTHRGSSAEQTNAGPNSSHIFDIPKSVADCLTTEEKAALDALLRVHGFSTFSSQLLTSSSSPLNQEGRKHEAFDRGVHQQMDGKHNSIEVVQSTYFSHREEVTLHLGLTLNKEKLKLHIATTVMIARRDAILHHFLCILSSYLHDL